MTAPVAARERVLGPASLRPPWSRPRVATWSAVVVSILASAWAVTRVNLAPTALVSGSGDIANLLARMVPPRFDNFSSTLSLVAQTFWIAVAGTFLATVLGIPLAFLYARPTSPHRLARRLAGGVIVACRAIPDIIFALIFVRALSIGALPGVLAIGLHSIGMIGKLCAEAIERAEIGPIDAVASAGATRLQRTVSGVVPQVIPSFVSTVLYRLDINIRGSVILGYVGAGGIGVALRAAFGRLDYPNALGIVMVIAVIVLGCELGSTVVRRAVLGAGRSPSRASSSPPLGGHLRPPLVGERLRLRLFALVAAGLVAVSLWQVHISPGTLAGALPQIGRVVRQFVPPDFTSARSAMVTGMIETVAIAIASTALASLAAVPAGLLAARNVAPFRWLYLAVRYALVGWRSLPELAVAIVFVAAVGLGPFAGVLAMSIVSFGLIAKLVADAAEEVDGGPSEAVASTGATRLQRTLASVVPQAVPSIVGAVLYTLDVNIRSAAVLGIVGAGGIGFLLNRSIASLNYQVTGAILVLVFILVYGIESLSASLRKAMS